MFLNWPFLRSVSPQDRLLLRCLWTCHRKVWLLLDAKSYSVKFSSKLANAEGNASRQQLRKKRHMSHYSTHMCAFSFHRAGLPVLFIFLDVCEELLTERLIQRAGEHFFPPALLRSQLEV